MSHIRSFGFGDDERWRHVPRPEGAEFAYPADVIEQLPLFAQDLATYVDIATKILDRVIEPAILPHTIHATNIEKIPFRSDFIQDVLLREYYGYGVHMAEGAVGHNQKPLPDFCAVHVDKEDREILPLIKAFSHREHPYGSLLHEIYLGVPSRALMKGDSARVELENHIAAAFPDKETRGANLVERVFMTSLVTQATRKAGLLKEQFWEYERLRAEGITPLAYETLAGMTATVLRSTIDATKPPPPHKRDEYRLAPPKR